MILGFLVSLVLAIALSLGASALHNLRYGGKTKLTSGGSTTQPSSLVGFTTSYYSSSGHFSLTIADSGFWVPIDTFAVGHSDTMYCATSFQYYDSGYDRNANLTTAGIIQLTGNARTAENTYTVATLGVQNIFLSQSGFTGSIVWNMPFGVFAPYSQVKAYNAGWDGFFLINSDVGTFCKTTRTGRYVIISGQWYVVPGMSRVVSPIFKNAIMSK